MARHGIFSKYRSEIIQGLENGLSVYEIAKSIEEKHDTHINENSLRTHIHSTSLLKELYNESKKRPKRVTIDTVSSEILDARINAQAETNDFIRKLKVEYEDLIKNKEMKYSSNNAGYMVFVTMERAKMVLEDRNANIMEIRTAQKVYEDSATFLSRLEQESRLENANVSFELNPNTENDPSVFENFARAVRIANEKARGNYDYSKDQALLFEHSE